MPDPTTPPAAPPAPPADPAADPTGGDAGTPPAGAPAEPPVAGEEALGDAGKKALDAMKAKWKDAEAKAKEHATELAAMKAKVEGTEAEHAAAAEAQKVKDEALAAANTRILKAEVRATAAGKLSDPADALLYLNLSDFEVGADGEVDSSLIAAAIDDLVKNKPYLAAQGTPRFQGGADGGVRNDSTPPAQQLSRADLAGMTAEQIETARKEGRLNTVLGIKP